MATDLLATSSLEGRFTHLNPAWERTLGWTGAELMSRPYLEFGHPDDVEATLAVAGALLERSSRACSGATGCWSRSRPRSATRSSPARTRGFCFCSLPGRALAIPVR
jgi:PAS domain-containing protein